MGSKLVQVPTVAQRRVVDLNLKVLFREAAFLISGVKVNARIAPRLSREFHFELKVSEVCRSYWSCIKQMRTGPIRG